MRPDWLIDILLPPRCVHCGDIVVRQADLCACCWRDLLFIDAPVCLICGRPLTDAMHDSGVYAEDAVCAACLQHPLPYARARAVLRYDDASKRMLIPFKHFDRTDYAPLFARWLTSLARASLAGGGGDTLVVPVPLHRRRLWRRRYNQAALLARYIADALSADISVEEVRRKPIVNMFQPDLIQRVKPTPSQGMLGRKARMRNVAGAFRMTENAKAMALGRRILLIDDVLTTGATVAACSRQLQAAGASAVIVLTVARVL